MALAFVRKFRGNKSIHGARKLVRSLSGENLLLQSKENQVEEFSKTVSLLRKRLENICTNATETEKSSIVLPLLEDNAPVNLLDALGKVDFETRKDVCYLFIFILRTSPDSATYIDLKRYLEGKKEVIVEKLMSIYSAEDTQLNASDLICQCLNHKCLHEQFLFYFEYFSTILQPLLESSDFDVCSDAFLVFSKIFLQNKQLVAKFLTDNYDAFLTKYSVLLKSQQYYTRRQSLAIFRTMLYVDVNHSLRMKFIGDRSNLIWVMNMMQSDSRWIRAESYAIFKLFKDNPYKKKEIDNIFKLNQQALEAYYIQMDAKNPFET